MRALPVVAAALLVCSAVVGTTAGLSASVPVGDGPAGDADRIGGSAVSPAAATGTAVEQTDGAIRQEINVLDIPPASVDRWGVEQQYVDLGPALGLSTNATTGRLRTLAAVERIEAANTTEERRDRLRTALVELEGQVDELDRQQTAAVAAYGRGDSDARELLVALVRISVAAEELGDRRSRIERLAADTRGFNADRGRLASIGNRLSAFTGPVRAHAETVLRGEAPTHRFYVATGPGSVTVSTIVDDAYLRESYRGNLRNGAGDAIELETALDIVATGYPVIWNTTREQTQVFGGGETYPVRIAHSRGDLTAFVDSNARTVYAEHQRRPLPSMTAERRVQRTADGLRLEINTTYPGGPSRIRVVNASTGDPVDAPVSMTSGTGGTTRLGTTGNDGVLWTLSPYRRYTITVEDTVDATVDPGAPPRVDAGPGPRSESGGGSGIGTPAPTPTST